MKIIEHPAQSQFIRPDVAFYCTTPPTPVNHAANAAPAKAVARNGTGRYYGPLQAESGNLTIARSWKRGEGPIYRRPPDLLLDRVRGMQDRRDWTAHFFTQPDNKMTIEGYLDSGCAPLGKGRNETGMPMPPAPFPERAGRTDVKR